MRSWIGAIVSLAVVVMIVHECRGSPARRSGPRHVSHSPANASGSPSSRWMK